MSDESTSVHEAAHAVIGRLLGLSWSTATIRPGGDLLGVVVFQPADWPPDAALNDAAEFADLALRRLRTSLAGGIAEVEAGFPYDAVGCSFDNAAAVELAEYAGGPEGTQSAIDQATSDTERLVREHWAVIVAVSQALQRRGTLGPSDVDAILARFQEGRGC